MKLPRKLDLQGKMIPRAQLQRPSVACHSSRLFSTYLPLDLGPDFSSDCYSAIDLMRESSQLPIKHLHQSMHMGSGGKAMHMELHISTS